MHEKPNQPEERPPLSIDAYDGDWLKPPVRLGDDGAIYLRDPDAVGGTRRIEPGSPAWRERLVDLDAADRQRALAFDA